MLKLIMPKMGESVAEATILKWLKKEGDRVEADESILEIATDKVDTEVPSPASGILTKCLFSEGQVVKVGEVIAMITSDKEEQVGTPPTPPSPSIPEKTTHSTSNGKPLHHQTVDPSPMIDETFSKISTEGRFYSPLVRNIAKESGISFKELELIQGSGSNNRLTKQDLLKHLEKKNSQVEIQTPISTVSVKSLPPTNSSGGNVEIIEMDRMRKLIADHMVMSKQTSPHVTSFVEADVTNMVKWRERVKGDFEKREKEKITFTPLFIEAVCKAIKDFPMINVSVDGTKIIIKKDINIGMATALPSGNLIVPVIRNADYLNLIGITKMVNDLANRARNNKLKPDEIQDGTFTITNVGTFGNVMGTPIINQPQVAILALGAIRKKPVVIETPEGDTIGIRQMMFLSLSYDHRVVDGSLGGSFLRRIADYLEQFDASRQI